MPAVTPDLARWSPRALQALRDLATDSLPLRVRGACMEPELPTGTLVGIRAARWYWPGDLVALAAPDGGLRLHRLLGYRRHLGRFCLVTRGDDCAALDFPTPLDRCLGRLEAVRPTLLERWRALAFLLRHVASRRSHRPRRARR